MANELSYLSYFSPSHMSHEILETILVKHQRLVERLFERTQLSALTETKHHTLLLGPRGIGKSYIAALVYYRIKAQEALSEKVAIAYFAEEEWSVASLTDLLIVILKALEREYGGLQDRIDGLYHLAIREIEMAASRLVREFVGTRTLFILVENLDEIFRGLGNEGQWAFRAFLSENPFVTILATTPSLFAGVTEHASAFYGFFQNIYLEELTVEEAAELLLKVAELYDDKALCNFLKTPIAKERVQAVHDLAGGHPRLYLLFAHMLTKESLDELVTPFMNLLGQLTPYYQSRMQLISPQQRRIVEFLCSVRGAVAVKEIAEKNLMTSQTASGQLDKLEAMYYVRRSKLGRESFYELREPLLRMVIEVNRGRGGPIRLIVEFLRGWYSRSERQERLSAAKNPMTQSYFSLSLGMEENTVDKSYREGDKLASSERDTDAGSTFDWNNHGFVRDKSREYRSEVQERDDEHKLNPLDQTVHLQNLQADIRKEVVLPTSNDDWLQINDQYCNRLLRGNDFADKIQPLVSLYWHECALGTLARQITDSIAAVLDDNVSQTVANSWLAAWRTARAESSELVVPIRILAASVEWKKSRSVRALMDLPIEERRILESLLPGN